MRRLMRNRVQKIIKFHLNFPHAFSKPEFSIPHTLHEQYYSLQALFQNRALHDE